MRALKLFVIMFLVGSLLGAGLATRPDLKLEYYLNSIFSKDKGGKYLRKYWRSIVKLTPVSRDTTGGTGFAVKAPSGESYTMTNAHVCELNENGRMVAHWDNGQYTILSVLEIDKAHDLCVLSKLPGDVIPLTVSKVEAELFDPIFVIGHPLLDPNTYSEGLVRSRQDVFIGKSYAGKKEECENDDLDAKKVFNPLLGEGWVCGLTFDAYSVSAFIFPGSSGSPVFNQRGEVAGVVFAGDTRSAYGMYVPVEYIEKLLAKY